MGAQLGNGIWERLGQENVTVQNDAHLFERTQVCLGAQCTQGGETNKQMVWCAKLKERSGTDTKRTSVSAFMAVSMRLPASGIMMKFMSKLGLISNP